MQFQKNSSSGALASIGKLLIKLLFVGIIIFLVTILLARVDFPAPNKKIEKVLPNDNFKTIK